MKKKTVSQPTNLKGWELVDVGCCHYESFISICPLCAALVRGAAYDSSISRKHVTAHEAWHAANGTKVTE